MKLHTIRGGSRGALESGKYNIAVPISLGNKWFTVGNIIQLIRWSLQYTRKEVIVYVADTIHAINLEVRNNNMSKERALRVAKRKGQKILDGVKREVEKTFTPEEQDKIVYATWDDLADENYKKKVDYLYQIYNSNPDFKSYITSIVQKLTSNEIQPFNEKELEHLGTYILEELPEIVAYVPIKGIIYEANAYPFDGEITQLAEDIQQGKLFSEIKANILDTEPKVFLEVR